MTFPLKDIVKAAIKYLSDAVNLVAPDEVTPELAEKVQQVALPVYSIAKTLGKKWVSDTENDLDDAVLTEVVEICELAAAKYGFILDPTQIPL
jgi:hypothetical protein